MGIPSYFLHIVKRHPAILKKIALLGPNIDNFYADCNGIIYNAVYETVLGTKNIDVYEAEIILAVCTKIQTYIDMFQPKEKIIIAFDGVAPVAKLNQQRERRYKSWLTGDLQKRIDKNNATKPSKLNKNTNAVNQNPDTSAIWNTSSITPGTAFMNKLHTLVTAHFKSNTKVIVSSSCESGEGEHKIFQHIRDFPDAHKNQTTIIYGLDADLIMLCLNHLHISERIFLYRETPEFLKSVDKTLDETCQYFVDIPELAQSIIKYMNCMHDKCGQVSEKIEFQNEKCRMFDYIFICFMLGNDFMPHFPAVNIRTTGIDTLLDAYRQTIGCKPGEYLICLTPNQNNNCANTNINWPNYKLLVEHLANNEDSLFRQEYKKRDRWQQQQLMHNSNNSKSHPNPETNFATSVVVEISDIVSEWSNDELPSSIDELNMCPIKYRDKEKQINPFTNNWERRYYETLFHVKMTASVCKQICTNYLEGMEWTFKYYSSGCVDWRWSYNYHYPPLLKDLLQFIPDSKCYNFLEVKEPDPIRDVVQLCYVLPRPSLHLLPPKIMDKLLKRCDPDSLYTTNHRVNWSFCKFFWECHTEMPHLDLNLLESICSE
jgi:5'-3' exonuclease